MRHAVLGPGGIGGLVGAVLAGAGEEVTLVVRPGSEALYPPELSLESPFGNIEAPVRIAATVGEPLDLLWIAVKATQLERALQSVPEGAGVSGGAGGFAIVPLLNGIDHVALLRARFGRDRVIPATIGVESERLAPGRIAMRSPFVRLAVLASGRERIASAVAILARFGFECRYMEDETTLLWSKLVFLAPIALSTAAARGPIGQVLGDAESAALLEAAVREACAVAEREGATVDAGAAIARTRSLPPQMRSSAERDVERGNVTELDALAAPIVRGARQHGVTLRAIPDLMRRLGLPARPRSG